MLLGQTGRRDDATNANKQSPDQRNDSSTLKTGECRDESKKNLNKLKTLTDLTNTHISYPNTILTPLFRLYPVFYLDTLTVNSNTVQY